MKGDTATMASFKLRVFWVTEQRSPQEIAAALADFCFEQRKSVLYSWTLVSE